jgi:hypothetical protein
MHVPWKEAIGGDPSYFLSSFKIYIKGEDSKTQFEIRRVLCVGCGQRWNKYERSDESGFKAGVNGLTHANTLAAWHNDNKDIKLKMTR